jgi:thiol-disulfide isomerase/thioredoxin
LRSFLKALIPTVLTGLILIGLFVYWRNQSSPKDALEDLNSMTLMEQQGVPGVVGQDVLSAREFVLEQLRGKVVIINFWASWCGPCVEEIPGLIQLVEKFNGEIRLVAISNDSSEDQMRAFLKAFPGLRSSFIHLLWDPKFEFMKSYSVTRLPESFIVDRQLKLKKKIVGTINWMSSDAQNYFQELIEATP